VNAEGHEIVGAEILVADVGHVLNELARNVMNRKGKKLFLIQARVAELFHSGDVIGAGGKGEFSAAVAVAEAAVKAHRAGVASQLEMYGRILCGGDAGVEADEVADFVGVAPGVVMAPAGGALDLEIEAAAGGTFVEFGRPVSVNGVVGSSARNTRRESRRHQECRREPQGEFMHGTYLRTCEDVGEGRLFHGS
jgi:hypothetical protein